MPRQTKVTAAAVSMMTALSNAPVIRYVCSVCDRKFLRQSMMEIHMRTAHADVQGSFESPENGLNQKDNTLVIHEDAPPNMPTLTATIPDMVMAPPQQQQQQVVIQQSVTNMQEVDIGQPQEQQVHQLLHGTLLSQPMSMQIPQQSQAQQHQQMQHNMQSILRSNVANNTTLTIAHEQIQPMPDDYVGYIYTQQQPQQQQNQ